MTAELIKFQIHAQWFRTQGAFFSLHYIIDNNIFMLKYFSLNLVTEVYVYWKPFLHSGSTQSTFNFGAIIRSEVLKNSSGSSLFCVNISGLDKLLNEYHFPQQSLPNERELKIPDRHKSFQPLVVSILLKYFIYMFLLCRIIPEQCLGMNIATDKSYLLKEGATVSKTIQNHSNPFFIVTHHLVEKTKPSWEWGTYTEMYSV